MPSALLPICRVGTLRGGQSLLVQSIAGPDWYWWEPELDGRLFFHSVTEWSEVEWVGVPLSTRSVRQVCRSSLVKAAAVE